MADRVTDRVTFVEPTADCIYCHHPVSGHVPLSLGIYRECLWIVKWFNASTKRTYLDKCPCYCYGDRR